MFQTNVADKIKTCIFVQYFYFVNRAVYEKMWKTLIEPNRTQEDMAHDH